MLDEGQRRLVERELDEIDALVTKSSALTDVPKGEEPSFERLAALSQILNSFYTGLERVFDRIARQVDGASPAGERWHAELLSAMARPASHRPAVLSKECHARLREYLAFRHRSRLDTRTRSSGGRCGTSWGTSSPCGGRRAWRSGATWRPASPVRRIRARTETS
mgnify:FL=1